VAWQALGGLGGLRQLGVAQGSSEPPEPLEHARPAPEHARELVEHAKKALEAPSYPELPWATPSCLKPPKATKACQANPT